MRVCVIGLGRMGRGMAINLVSKGNIIYGYDVNKAVYAMVRGAGVKSVDSIGQCGNSDYVILALPTGKESAR
ncbi:NAD(P)-binding domain-containing protein [Vulcanisaeta sp. JCM 14467]|uniref:NAD(P)-binding domain-containing protein n=1 Tax=Vulcanisaeta sp. JCM 14467 TaxID=1295370 RepID=UPI0006CF95AA|nr:NAD(P)-binding domain-containing protein [Vulcanisaeta sp. JCM 14467]